MYKTIFYTSPKLVFIKSSTNAQLVLLKPDTKYVIYIIIIKFQGYKLSAFCRLSYPLFPVCLLLSWSIYWKSFFWQFVQMFSSFISFLIRVVYACFYLRLRIGNICKVFYIIPLLCFGETCLQMVANKSGNKVCTTLEAVKQHKMN